MFHACHTPYTVVVVVDLSPSSYPSRISLHNVESILEGDLVIASEYFGCRVCLSSFSPSSRELLHEGRKDSEDSNFPKENESGISIELNPLSAA